MRFAIDGEQETPAGLEDAEHLFKAIARVTRSEVMDSETRKHKRKRRIVKG